MLSGVSFILIYNLYANVYVIVIIIKPTCIGEKIDEIMFKEEKKNLRLNKNTSRHLERF